MTDRNEALGQHEVIPGQETLDGIDHRHPFAEHVDGAKSPVGSPTFGGQVEAGEYYDEADGVDTSHDKEVRAGNRRAVILSVAGGIVATGLTAYISYQRLRRHPGHNQD